MSNRAFADLNYPPDYYDFVPGDLVFPGDGGFWYDFGDWDNMYLDRAMTTRVTAAGQSVAAVRDKGRNNKHLFQDTAGRRPKSFVQGGFKCLDFNSANLECMYSDAVGMALATCHGWVIGETDNSTAFHRFLATSTTAADTVGPSALAVNSGDTGQVFDVRGLAVSGVPALRVQINGSGVTPFAVYEYEIAGVSSKAWQNNVLGTQDNSSGGLNALSSNRIVVGALSNLGDPSPNPPGHLDGRIWQILHLGTIPSAFDEGRAEAWFAKWRY